MMPEDINKGRKPLFADDISLLYDNCTNCIGIDTGEVFWYSGRPEVEQWMNSLLQLSLDRQKYFLLAEGTWNRNHWTRFFNNRYTQLHDANLGKAT
ncbi:hypothetical protein GCM10008018_12830 [Paenibacillus marchantiophytorum]|uniref:Uncharacterized protein n=1 Tax=Paenibacillus marchantiophytorum TaxID=1619310 RepID=A0ABQ2BR35_9BACL|nr:hypothetical protein [Paenibacillus marchantiophytorum]GGI45571.1 hypothetical protein GCM10008018_12830 [Paenibacillus marchantiophytorum]